MRACQVFDRPPPRGGGGVRLAHDGGVSAGCRRGSSLLPTRFPPRSVRTSEGVPSLRHPLSHLLAQMTAPPNGGAQSGMASLPFVSPPPRGGGGVRLAHDGGVSAGCRQADSLCQVLTELFCSGAEPPRSRKSQTHDGCRDAALVASACDANARLSLSPPIAARKLHRGLRVSPRALDRRVRRQSAWLNQRHGGRCRTDRVARSAGLQSASILELRCTAAYGCDRRPDYLRSDATRKIVLVRRYSRTFRPPPPGGGGMREAHDGGAGPGRAKTATFRCSRSREIFRRQRHPLSPPLARRTAPPNGGARRFNP